MRLAHVHDVLLRYANNGRREEFRKFVLKYRPRVKHTVVLEPSAALRVVNTFRAPHTPADPYPPRRNQSDFRTPVRKFRPVSVAFRPSTGFSALFRRVSLFFFSLSTRSKNRVFRKRTEIFRVELYCVRRLIFTFSKWCRPSVFNVTPERRMFFGKKKKKMTTALERIVPSRFEPHVT